MTSEEKKTRQSDAQEKVIKSNENQIEITVAQLKLFTDKLHTTKFKIIPSIIMAQIASGCRLIEILNKEFEFTESKKENYIIQSDVAKNRTDARAVEKPVLFITPTAFLSLIKEIRLNLTNKPDDTNIKLSNRYGKRVNALVVKIAGEVGMPLEISSSHDMRRIYANYSYILHAKRNVSLQIWIAQILGHGDLTSTANYSTLKII
jgi:integrase